MQSRNKFCDETQWARNRKWPGLGTVRHGRLLGTEPNLVREMHVERFFGMKGI